MTGHEVAGDTRERSTGVCVYGVQLVVRFARYYYYCSAIVSAAGSTTGTVAIELFDN